MLFQHQWDPASSHTSTIREPGTQEAHLPAAPGGPEIFPPSVNEALGEGTPTLPPNEPFFSTFCPLVEVLWDL